MNPDILQLVTPSIAHSMVMFDNCDQLRRFDPPIEESIHCPLLVASLTEMTIGNIQKLEGVFIMQDWWKAEANTTNFKDQVSYIENGLNNQFDDQTLGNLFNNAKPSWKDKFKNKHWIFTNAVWGLRNADISTGYLGDRIHSYALPVWTSLIREIMSQRPNNELNVYLAGIGWAGGLPNIQNSQLFEGIALNDYLGKWCKYLENKRNINPINNEIVNGLDKVKVRVVNHPYTWSIKNPIDGPFKND